MSEKKTNKLAATFKSQDTEEWLDIHFTRPLGLLWANFFNLFGTHPKYGVSGRKIASVTYRTQPSQRAKPLYELT